MADRPLIIVGASARAAAQSAIRAGFSPWCVDLFADRDLRAIAPARRCDFCDYPDALPSMLEDAPAGAPVLLTGAMENHLAVVRQIERDHPMIGPSAEAMAKVRRPGALAALAGGPILRTPSQAVGEAGRSQVVKPTRSSHGHGVRFWNGEAITPDERVEPFIEGQPMSAIYSTLSGGPRLLDVTRQIIGEGAFGAAGPFTYVGNLAPAPLPPEQAAALARLGERLVDKHAMRGVFGVDFIHGADGRCWLLEVNPRYTAGVEVVEWATARGSLGEVKGEPAGPCAGKAIVYARGDAVVGQLDDLWASGLIADVPDAGTLIGRGRPICTALARADAPEACTAKLYDVAEQIYTRLADAPATTHHQR